MVGLFDTIFNDKNNFNNGLKNMTLLDALQNTQMQETQDAETQEVETQEIEAEGVEFHPSRNLNTINREGEPYIVLGTLNSAHVQSASSIQFLRGTPLYDTAKQLNIQHLFLWRVMNSWQLVIKEETSRDPEKIATLARGIFGNVFRGIAIQILNVLDSLPAAQEATHLIVSHRKTANEAQGPSLTT